MREGWKRVRKGKRAFNWGGTEGVDVGVGVCGEAYMDCTRTILEHKESM